MKNLKIAFLVLLAAVLMASCTQVKIVDMIPGGDKEETPVSDLPKIIDPETILRDAANGAEGLSYEVETSNEPFASRAAGDDAAAPVYYQMVDTFRGYKSSYGLINRGTLTIDFNDHERNLSYVANGHGLVVASNTEVRTRRTDAEGLEGTVKGFAFTGNGTVSVTADYRVEVDPYKGSFTSGRDKVTVAESEGVVSGGNGEADSPFIISDIETLRNIHKFGDNVSFQLGADFEIESAIFIRNENVSLDLNGKSIEYYVTGNDHTGLLIVDGGSLIITGEGTLIASSGKYNTPLKVQRNGAVIINGGTYKSIAGDAIDIGVQDAEGGNVIINGGTFEGREFCIGIWGDSNVTINGGNFTAFDNAVIGTNGMDSGNPVIKIAGGEFNANIESFDSKGNAYIACGIYMACDVDVTITDAVFNINGGVGILLRGGSLDLQNASIVNNHVDNRESGLVGDSHVMLISDVAIVVDGERGSNYPASDTINVVNSGKYIPIYLDASGNPIQN